PSFASAQTTGREGVSEVKQCVMQNDIERCHKMMTPDSYAMFDRFFSYKLMPCLPTDFTYESEQEVPGGKTIVKAVMPADNKNTYRFNLVFVGKSPNVKLDLPETFHVGFGENWKNTVNVTEQLFLMMRQNMKNKLTCDVLRGLAMPQK